MNRHKYEAEFEINASQKMLYPYIYTASGLAQWFADDVNVEDGNIFNFIWDGKDHKAKMIAHRSNHYVKFQFLDDGVDHENAGEVEMRIEKNEMTDTVFMRIIDDTEVADNEELDEVWDNLITTLKETVGG